MYAIRKSAPTKALGLVKKNIEAEIHKKYPDRIIDDYLKQLKQYIQNR